MAVTFVKAFLIDGIIIAEVNEKFSVILAVFPKTFVTTIVHEDDNVFVTFAHVRTPAEVSVATDGSVLPDATANVQAPQYVVLLILDRRFTVIEPIELDETDPVIFPDASNAKIVPVTGIHVICGETAVSPRKDEKLIGATVGKDGCFPQ